MKKTMHQIWKGLAVGALALSVSCVKETGSEPGDAIVFRSATEYDNGAATRTEYSGAEITVGANTIERINWLSGDKIRIASNVAKCTDGTTGYADYTVTGVTTSGASSLADIAPVQANGLQWGSGTHSFYCVYPSPVVNSDISYTSTNAVSFSIPASQTYTLSGTTLTPDMDYAYMYAAVQTTPAASVNLAFKPLFTAFQFEVDSADDATITVTSFTLSSASKALSGSVTATMTAAATSASSSVSYGTFPTATDANKKITVTFNSGNGVTISQGHPIKFTIFALPQTYNDLTASFTTSDGETKTLALAQSDGTTFLSFAPGNKYNINGMGLPGKWTYSIVTPIADIVLDNEDYEAAFPTISIQRSRGGTKETNLPWKIYFSSTEPSIGDPVSTSWSETPLNDDSDHVWVAIEEGMDPASLRAWVEQWLIEQYPGIENQSNFQSFVTMFYNNYLYKLNDVLCVYEPEYSISQVLNPSAYPMIQALRANNLGTVDLSTMALDAGATAFTPGHSATTANCYVINGYGTFLIPLVYGNGVKNGSVNTSILNSASLSYNVSQQLISSSYILSDTNLSNRSGPYSARVLWQDTMRGMEIINENDIEVLTTKPSGALLNCAYLKIPIRREQIKPGNVVVGLYNESSGMIVWSWHLWITAESFTTKDVHYSSVARLSHLSCNLGWTPPIMYDNGTDRTQYAVIVCETSNRVVDTFRISQRYDSSSSVGGGAYSGTYYQWGRKDPFPPSDGSNGKRVFTTHNFHNIEQLTSTSMVFPTNLSYEIRWPNRYVSQAPELGSIDHSWNTQPSGVNDCRVIKSVYDPCPAGFSVPRRAAYAGFYHNNTIYGSWQGASGEQPAGYMFTTGSWSSTSPYDLFYPFLGICDPNNNLSVLTSYTAYWTAADYQYFTTVEGYGVTFSQGSVTQPSQTSIVYMLPVRPVREE